MHTVVLCCASRKCQQVIIRGAGSMGFSSMKFLFVFVVHLQSLSSSHGVTMFCAKGDEANMSMSPLTCLHAWHEWVYLKFSTHTHAHVGVLSRHLMFV